MKTLINRKKTILETLKDIKYWFLIGLVCCLTTANAQESKMRVAVFDPTSSGTSIDEGTKVAIREIISSTIVNVGSYDIVERSLLEKVMQEQSFSNSGAVDDNDATEIGKLAGANKVVLSVVTLTGGRNMLSIKMIDVKTASVERQQVKIVSSGELLDVVEPLTLALTDAKKNADSPSIIAYSTEKKKNKKNTSSSDKSSDNSVLPETINSNNTSIPEFNGSGVSFLPIGYEIGYQPEEFLIENLGPIYDNKLYNIVIDFSEALVLGQNMLSYIQQKFIDNPSQKAPKEGIYNKIINECNRFVQEMKKSKEQDFGYNPQAPITLVVKIREISEDGKNNTSDYVFVNTETKRPIVGVNIKSKGGKIGSFGNLLGDALEEDAAPKLKEKLKSGFKKYKKR